jgi:Carboxypeptidase regulatory-like domain
MPKTARLSISITKRNMFVQTIVLMRKNFLSNLLSIAILALAIFAFGCKRTEIPVTPDPIPTNPTTTVVNDLPQVTASVSGIVLDETNTPIANAVVTSGTATTTTNSNGMFIFQNISLSKENGNVTVVKAGYFKGIRSFKTSEGKNHTVRIQLMQRVLSGTVNAAAGGTITSNGGATIVFPANAFVTSAGAAYTGVVSVYSRWIDPTAANLPFVIPGDLRGVSTTGVENILTTYGMVAAELADASGNVLKIATGKTATVSFPIPASLSATAPPSIVLWHFDDASARWKENGTATKTGSTYTAQVDKFSFWNCDVPNSNFINLDYTLINATTNSPLVSTSTRIKRVNGSYGYGITNNAGFVSGLVPKNEALVLEVISGCSTVIYSQNIGPFASNISLGNINVTLPTAQFINFTGTLINCSGTAVTNGYVAMYATGGGGGYITTNTNTGAFSFSILNCTGASIAYNYQATDVTMGQQSATLNGNTTNGTVNLGNVSTCAAAAVSVYVAGFEGNFAKVWKNGVATNITNGAESGKLNSIFVNGNDVYVAGGETTPSGFRVAKVWKNGVATILTGAGGDANSVFVSGTDVYVAGFADNAVGIAFAKIWKNGVVTNLSNGTFDLDNANSVFVSGTDVYVAGVEYNSAGIAIAKVWKNGVATNLTSGILEAKASSVFVSGTDVYVVGYEANAIGFGTQAKVWKNGVATSLTNGNDYYYPNSVFVSGTDVYVAGYVSNAAGYVAKVWKNGVSTSLTNGNFEAKANSIFVFSSDVYVAGYEYNTSGVRTAKLWKNGLAINLPNIGGFSEANSVFVK